MEVGIYICIYGLNGKSHLVDNSPSMCQRTLNKKLKTMEEIPSFELLVRFTQEIFKTLQNIVILFVRPIE